MLPDDDANFTLAETLISTEQSDTENLYGQNVTFIDFITDGVAAALNVYYTPFLIIFGCLGNLLSIFIFYTSKLRLQSTSVYLSALALSDTLFLLQLLPPWLDAIKFSDIFYKPGFCQLNIYASYVTCCLSTWIVVAFTVERFVAVLYPLRRSFICTVTRAKYIVMVLTCIAFVMNIPVLKFTSPSEKECSIDFVYLDLAARFNLVDTAVAFTVPLGAIVILNVRIIYGVCKLQSARHQLLKVDQVPGTRGRLRVAPPPTLRSQHRVTRMLLIVSSVFVILNLPAYTMRVLAYNYDVNTSEYEQGNGNRWAAFQQLALTFFNTNFGINFMLYCLSGQNFRRAFCHAIPCLRHRTLRRAAARRIACHPARASSISTSYASAGTEAANTIALSSFVVEGQGPVRRHRSDPVIKRWKFQNNRQRNVNEEPAEEEDTYNLGAGTSEHSF